MCKAYNDEYGADVRIGRIFNSYGPRLRAEGFYGRVVSRFILQALKGQDLTVFGDDSQTRSFCYVSDTVTGLLQLTGREGLEGEVLNLGARRRQRFSHLPRRFWNCLILVLSSVSIRFLQGITGGVSPTSGRLARWSIGTRVWV